MTKPLSMTEAVAALKHKMETGILEVRCARAATVEHGRFPDILVYSAAVPAFDTACMFLVPVAGRGAFTRADRLFLNGIPGFIGPAPNERLGVVDVMFTSDMSAQDNPAYTGLHLFTDVLQDHELNVWCRSVEQTEHRAATRLSKMQFGRMTVFDAAVDPELGGLVDEALFPGARIRLNGGNAVIVGSGARYVDGQPSLSVIGDLFPMRPDLLIRDGRGTLDKHNLTFAIPLQAVAQPERLMERAAALAAGTPEAETPLLQEAEEALAADLASGIFRPADPGPLRRSAVNSVEATADSRPCHF